MMMCQLNGNYCAESKNVEVLVDQFGQNTKMNYFYTRAVMHIILRCQSIFMKRGKSNIVGGILSTMDSYVITTNILKTLNSEEQQTYFNEKDIESDDFYFRAKQGAK